MARILNPGETVNSYTIERKLNAGAMAVSYAAVNSTGEKVFFKQYKSPSVLVPWYSGYVAYQQELKHRIESTLAKSFTYRFIEFFEAAAGPKTFFQVFEFVDHGNDLETLLQQARSRPSSLSWSQRVTLAKVMMAGIHALHDAKIVHCDLKPANIQLFEDHSITAGYRLKVIDMDFSILSDRRAPWHGVEGYVGSPNYFSPEHLRGEIPSAPSDIFTCGLILYELLANGHPFLSEDEEGYHAAVLSGRPPKPTLLGTMPGEAKNSDVEALLLRCLSVNGTTRPTAEELLHALNGKRDTPPAPAPPKVKPTPAPTPKPAPTPAPTLASAGTIVLRAANGKTLRANVDIVVGKHTCREFGDDAQFMATDQLKLVRVDGKGWFVEPNTKAPNETLLNGKPVVARTQLAAGDTLGVGRASKGIVKLPLTVTIA